MKILILLLLYITVTCQAQQWPINGQQVARQKDEETKYSVNDRFYEKLKTIANNYMKQKNDEGKSNMLTLLVSDLLKSDPQPSRRLFQKPSMPYINNRYTNPTLYHRYRPTAPSYVHNPQHQYSNRIAPFRFTSPVIHSRFHVDEEEQIQQTRQATPNNQQSEVELKTRLAEIDKEALSKLSKEDREILVTELSLAEREALITKLENGQLDDVFPREENRFGGIGAPQGGLSSAVAQIGATAGRYIGNKLAGSLGARLGAAAGAYLGAAAASRFVKKSSPEVLSDNSLPDPSLQIYGNSYGAVMVNQ